MRLFLPAHVTILIVQFGFDESAIYQMLAKRGLVFI